MTPVLSVILLVVATSSLIAVAYQDFKYRGIHWIWVVLVFCSLTIKMLLESNWHIVFQNFVMNSLFLGMQLVVLFVYFSMKNKAITNIINRYIGLGDILFFLAICSAFSLLNFIVFLFLGLLGISAVFAGLFVLKRNEIQIPLAGLFSIGLIGVLILNELGIFNLYDDSYVLNKLQLV